MKILCRAKKSQAWYLIVQLKIAYRKMEACFVQSKISSTNIETLMLKFICKVLDPMSTLIVDIRITHVILCYKVLFYSELLVEHSKAQGALIGVYVKVYLRGVWIQRPNIRRYSACEILDPISVVAIDSGAFAAFPCFPLSRERENCITFRLISSRARP